MWVAWICRDFGDGGRMLHSWASWMHKLDGVSCWNCGLVIASQAHEKRMFPTVPIPNPFFYFHHHSTKTVQKNHFLIAKWKKVKQGLAWIETGNRNTYLFMIILKMKEYTNTTLLYQFLSFPSFLHVSPYSVLLSPNLF